MELTSRQLEIIALVRKHAPVIGDQIAEMLGVSRPTLRSDLAVLVMLGLLDAKPKVGYFLGKALAPELQAAKKLEGLQVKHIQGIPIIIRDTATVHDAVVTLFVENVGSLIIADEDGVLSGIVSRKDLLKCMLGGGTAAALPVSLVMTRQPNIITVSPDDLVLEAARKIIHHQVDSLPVLAPSTDQEFKGRLVVVGRITKTNMTQILVELAADPSSLTE